MGKKNEYVYDYITLLWRCESGLISTLEPIRALKACVVAILPMILN